MSRVGIAILISLLLGALLIGCNQNASVGGNDSIPKAQASSDDGTVQLAVFTDPLTIRTVDHLIVRVVLSHRIGTNIEILDPDWDAAGWTLLHEHRELNTIDGDLLRSSRIYTVEPFLEGAYDIPSFAVKTESGTVSTDPILISVESVLQNDDDGELAAAVGLLPPERASESIIPLLLAAGAVLGVIFAGALLYWVGRSPVRLQPSPIDRLRQVAQGACSDRNEALSIVHHAVESLDAHASLGPIRAECELARFAPSDEHSPDASDLATRALQIVEGAA